MAVGSSLKVVVKRGVTVERVGQGAKGLFGKKTYEVTATCDDESSTSAAQNQKTRFFLGDADVLVSCVGFRPETEIYRELQVRTHYHLLIIYKYSFN